MLAQNLIEYSFLESFLSGLRQFQIYVGDLPYTTWVIIAGVLLGLAAIFRYRPH
jgi:hypothetical protein